MTLLVIMLFIILILKYLDLTLHIVYIIKHRNEKPISSFDVMIENSNRRIENLMQEAFSNSKKL